MDNKEANSKFIPIVILVVLLLLLLFAYLLNALEPQEDTTVMNISPTVSIEVNEGSDAKLPQGFPVYPSSTITDSWERDSSASYGSSFVLNSEDALDEIYAYYINEIGKSGWELEVENPENYTINFKRDDTQGYIILSKIEDGNTLISITFARIKDE